VTVRREGRSMIYAARYETMNTLIAFLTENCCGGRPEQCLPAKKENSPRKTRKPQRAATAEPVS
jgi:ArsR family transcriptional regulator